MSHFVIYSLAIEYRKKIHSFFSCNMRKRIWVTTKYQKQEREKKTRYNKLTIELDKLFGFRTLDEFIICVKIAGSWPVCQPNVYWNRKTEWKTWCMVWVKGRESCQGHIFYFDFIGMLIWIIVFFFVLRGPHFGHTLSIYACTMKLYVFMWCFDGPI